MLLELVVVKVIVHISVVVTIFSSDRILFYLYRWSGVSVCFFFAGHPCFTQFSLTDFYILCTSLQIEYLDVRFCQSNSSHSLMIIMSSPFLSYSHFAAVARIYFPTAI